MRDEHAYFLILYSKIRLTLRFRLEKTNTFLIFYETSVYLKWHFCVPNVFFEESRVLKICKRKTLESAYFTRVSRVFDNGAGDGNRTRDPHLTKVVLYR